MTSTGQKMFSIILPTRERLVGLKKTLDSFATTTDDLPSLEVILVCDKDDQTLPQLQELINTYSLDIMALVRDRSEWFCRDYYNWGCAKARGANLMCFNDDCTVETPHWDSLIKRAVGSRQVYCVDLWDSTHEELHSFPRFPMVSRKAYEAMGQFFYPQIRMWGADTLSAMLHNAAGTMIPCHEVKLQHDHLPSKTFYDRFEQDKKDGVFPVDIRRELHALREVKEAQDGELIRGNQESRTAVGE